MKITIGIAEDEQLSLKGYCLLIESFQSFDVLLAATDGQQLLEGLNKIHSIPEIVILDVKMPKKNGVETAKEISENYPLIKIVALSTNDDDFNIIKMIRAGCCAYLVKGIDSAEFKTALLEIHENGYYNGDAYNINARRLMRKSLELPLVINAKQHEFLKLSSSDLTYKQIAARMYLSERTIDGYREALFEKLNVQSRVGMVLEGLRQQLIEL